MIPKKRCSGGAPRLSRARSGSGDPTIAGRSCLNSEMEKADEFRAGPAFWGFVSLNVLWRIMDCS